MSEVEQRENGHQGERDAHRDDEGAARAAEKDDENQEYERDAFENRLADLVDGGAHQIVAVDVGLDPHAGGRQFGIQFGHLGVDTLQGLRRILILQHQDDAFDGVGIRILAEYAFAFLVAERGAPQVAHQDGSAAHLGDDDGADLLQIMNQPHPADHIALIAARNPAAPRIGVVVVDGIDDIGDAEAIALQLPGIQVQLVFGGEAAEVGVIDHPGNGFQGGNHGPALDLR